MADLDTTLELLDQEIRTLHKFCLNKKFNAYEIEQCAEPLLNEVGQYRKRRRFKALVCFTALLCLGLAIVLQDPMYKLIGVNLRLATIKILPFFDWTIFRETTCLLNNPFYIGPHLVEDDCQLCENLGPDIPRLANASKSVIAQNYILQDRPFIVTDAMKAWPAMNDFNIKFLNQLHESEDYLKQMAPCFFSTNVRGMKESARVLLQRAAQGNIDQFYAHWEHCHKPAAKVFRQFYSRPYFIPDMVEASESNWLFVASHYESTKFKPIDMAVPLVWVGVIRGEMKVGLTPRSPCRDICPVLYATLKRGEILVLTDIMWFLDYEPVAQHEFIALGGGGFFD